MQQMTEAKKKMGRIKGDPIGQPPRRHQVVVKARDEWGDWVRRGAERCGMSVSQATEAGLQMLFASKGYKAKMPRR